MLLADRGYDADWFRDALEEKGIKPSMYLKIKFPSLGDEVVTKIFLQAIVNPQS